MADVSDTSELFDLELHEDEKARDSDDDRIELDDVSNRINYAAPGHQTTHPCTLLFSPNPAACPPIQVLHARVFSLFTFFALSGSPSPEHREKQKEIFPLFWALNSASYLLRKSPPQMPSAASAKFSIYSL